MFTILPPSWNPGKCLKTSKIGHFGTQNAIEMLGILDGGIKGNGEDDWKGYKI
jgi:hypothetical protein